jgi:hypothetical protein
MSTPATIDFPMFKAEVIGVHAASRSAAGCSQDDRRKDQEEKRELVPAAPATVNARQYSQRTALARGLQAGLLLPGSLPGRRRTRRLLRHRRRRARSRRRLLRHLFSSWRLVGFYLPGIRQFHPWNRYCMVTVLSP